ncbi:MAG TPA: hypothetical protein VFF50_13325 [Candidatus Deferrimicrobiaceae bacterium]|jgi:hypothetical protein|nr:hypothetical protein [Candidatus Deferrimicrobiaceae bacterium]
MKRAIFGKDVGKENLALVQMAVPVPINVISYYETYMNVICSYDVKMIFYQVERFDFLGWLLCNG